MTNRKTVSLGVLAENRKAEIERMVDSIKGKAGSALWTQQLRAATRGGGRKCLGIPMIGEAERPEKSRS